jgi:hypothetical protein
MKETKNEKIRMTLNVFCESELALQVRAHGWDDRRYQVLFVSPFMDQANKECYIEYVQDTL